MPSRDDILDEHSLQFHTNTKSTRSSSSMAQTFRQGSRIFNASNWRGLIWSSASTISKHSQNLRCSNEPSGCLPSCVNFVALKFCIYGSGTKYFLKCSICLAHISYLCLYAARPLWWSLNGCIESKLLGFDFQSMRSWWFWAVVFVNKNSKRCVAMDVCELMIARAAWLSWNA